MRKNAEQLKRASVAKTGELNLSKLYSYGFAEDLFKRITCDTWWQITWFGYVY